MVEERWTVIMFSTLFWLLAAELQARVISRANRSSRASLLLCGSSAASQGTPRVGLDCEADSDCREQIVTLETLYHPDDRLIK